MDGGWVWGRVRVGVGVEAWVDENVGLIVGVGVGVSV